jgi:hypothetical protein
MNSRTIALLFGTCLVAFGCKSRTETAPAPAPTTEKVDKSDEDKSAGTQDEPAEEGWTPKPIGGGPAPTIEPTPTPTPQPKTTTKPKTTTTAPKTTPSASPSATPSGWAWPQSVPTWPWGTTGGDAGPQTTPAPTTTPAPAPAPSASPSTTQPTIPWPWATQQ